MAVIVCPACGSEFRAALQGGTVVLAFEFEEWEISCHDNKRGDPALCAAVRPIVLERLARAGHRTPLKRPDCKRGRQDDQ